MARRRWKKILGITFLAIIIIFYLGITFTIGWRPFIGAKKRAVTDRKFEPTPQRLARGKYLVDGVIGCFGCHTDLDWSKPGAPPIAGKEGSGHVWADQDQPWLIAPNITPDQETGFCKHHTRGIRNWLLQRHFVCAGDAHRQSRSATAPRVNAVVLLWQDD